MKAPSLVLSNTMMVDKWHILYKLEHKNCANDKNKYQLFHIFWNIYCVKPEANKEQQEKQSVHALRDLYFCWENMTCKIITIRL